MSSTTIRVDLATRDALAALAREHNTSLGETVREAAEALRRARFAQRTVDSFARLRADEAAWQDYEAEAEGTSVGDGIGR